MEKTLIFLHGYGVRGWFWDGFTDYFTSSEGGAFTRILTPDLDMRNVDALLDSTEKLVEEEADRNGGVWLVGHSLGGAVASVVASRLGASLVRKLVCVATPFGHNRTAMRGFIRFLIRHRLIPDFVARPQFYSKQTPLAIQKAMFAKVVPESLELQESIMAENHFHTAMLRKLEQPSLVVCSASDRIVPAEQARQLAATIGAGVHLFPPTDGVAHDDFVAAPAVRAAAQTVIGTFLAQKEV